jgi:hypothetical protein
MKIALLVLVRAATIAIIGIGMFALIRIASV